MTSPGELLDASWQSLDCPSSELRLEFTLPTGQSFRWRKTGPQEYTGVIQQRVVQMRQEEDDVLFRVLARGDGALPGEDAAALHDYFNLGSRMADLSAHWAQRDPRFRNIHPYFPGARVLRQDPVECLFQFVCSSNNHISRIHGMVERLCRTYGTPLPVVADADAAACPQDLSFYAFPTLENLEEATDEALRAEGFGYRAKFIVGSVKMLLEKEGGGAAWLQQLRQVPYQEASDALCTLPGVGPKVAACVCLFSLDKHAAIPVDTHVWQLATRYYTPSLKGKTLTKPLMVAVEAALQERFGRHAGWAHNTLFISELASHRHLLPPHLQPGGRAKSGSLPKAAAAAAALAASAVVEAVPAPLGRGSRTKARRVAEVYATAGQEDVFVNDQAEVSRAGKGNHGPSMQNEAATELKVRKRKGAAKAALAASILGSVSAEAVEGQPAVKQAQESAVLAASGKEQSSMPERMSAAGDCSGEVGSGLSPEGVSAGAAFACKAEQAPAQRQHFRDWKRRRAGPAAEEPGQLDPVAKLIKTQAS